MKARIPHVVWRNGIAHFVVRMGGKQIWRSLKTRSTTEARVQAADLYLKLIGGQRPDHPRPIKLHGLLRRFLSDRTPDLAPRTAKSYWERLEAFYRWAHEREVEWIADVTPEFLLSYRRERLEEKRSPATVASDLRHVRAAFRYGLRMGWIAADPFERLPPTRRVALPEKHVLSWGELRALVKAAHDLRPVILLAAFAGLRRGELAHLRYEDLDWERGLIHVVNRPPEFVIKTYQARSVPMGRMLRWLLPRETTGYVCPFRDGARLSREIKDVFTAAKVKGYLHLLRHTWISYLRLAGYPTPYVMAWAGHSRSQTTDGYSHVRQVVAQKDVRLFRRAIGNAEVMKPF